MSMAIIHVLWVSIMIILSFRLIGANRKIVFFAIVNNLSNQHRVYYQLNQSAYHELKRLSLNSSLITSMIK